MATRYEVYAWHPAISSSCAKVRTDSYSYAEEALANICSVNEGWVGYIYDNTRNCRVAAVGVAL